VKYTKPAIVFVSILMSADRFDEKMKGLTANQLVAGLITLCYNWQYRTYVLNTGGSGEVIAMISSSDLVYYFALNLRVLDRQLDGLTHEDSLLQLPFRGNCMNWVLGHILNNRSYFMRTLLDIEPVVASDVTARYESDSDPVTPDSDDILQLERLVELLNESQEKISERLEAMTDADFAATDENGNTLGKRLLFFYFHETYHTGQTELLRQLTGVDDKVI
jgi:hypothetical protein